MNSKYLALGLISLATAGTALFAPVAFADNGKRGDHDDRKEIQREIKDLRKDLKDIARSTGVMINIAPSGNVHVKGATVTAVSGNTVSAKTVWGSTTLNWTVNANSSTEILGNSSGKGNGRIALADIKVGDLVNWSGMLDSSAAALTVNAQVLRDVSTKNRPAPTTPTVQDTFQGTMQSLASTTAPTTLTLQSGNQTFTVNIPTSAVILKNNFTATTLANFQVGDIVRVFGSLSTATSSVIDALVVRNATR